MADKIKALKETLYVKILTTEDVSNLRKCLENCEKKSLLAWTDSNGYDVLHHSIMAGNIEAVGIIFAMGLFKPPHEPKCHPYIHLAANYGNRSIAVMLIQERPNDYSTKKTKFKYAKLPTENSVKMVDGLSMVTPLDVAGDCGHVVCIRSILDVSSVRVKLGITGADNHLSAACASNSPSALRLLLKQKSSAEDIKSAVGTALKNANAECLDVLLKCNTSLTSLFSGMNLYHVLYSYSLSFKKEWYESLLTVTSVLLKHKQNPVCSVPFRTYPLYSLISHTPASDFGKSFPYIAACMVVLLNAGVDPNFDEVKFELEHESKNVKTAFGRSAFSSAFHCLFGNVVTLVKHFEDDATNIRRFVTKCTESLLRHGANPAIFGPIEDENFTGSALHAFLCVSIPLGLDERSINTFRLLIQNGADPNQNENGIYAINVLCESVLIHPEKFEKMQKYDEAILIDYVHEIVDTLLDNMTVTSLTEATKYPYDGKPAHDVQRKAFKYCKSETNNRSTVVQTLKNLTRIEILRLCKWRSTKVVELPIPNALKKFINRVQ